MKKKIVFIIPYLVRGRTEKVLAYINKRLDVDECILKLRRGRRLLEIEFILS